MKIGIIGSRGIPNEYGGFEQFAEYLSIGLVKKGCEVWVYSPHSHSFQSPIYYGVNIIHCHDPEGSLGAFGQFIYDYHCIKDSTKRNFDIILQLGYTSSAIWNWMFDKSAIIVTNPDGLEWQRSKYRRPIRHFLKLSEKIVIKKSHHLVADSTEIYDYLRKTYERDFSYIPYGAENFNNPNPEGLGMFRLKPKGYHLITARMQPDNHIEEIVRGVKYSNTKLPLLVVGNLNNSYAKRLKHTYSSPEILFVGGIYDQELLNNLRYYSMVYFHGHSAGGTNPSLIEAMASSTTICAHENRFNKAVLGEDATYFKDQSDISRFLDNGMDSEVWQTKQKNNIEKVATIFHKQTIVDQYYDLFQQVIKKT